MALKPNPGHRGDPVFLTKALREFGVTVKELPGAYNRGHGDFGIIQGVFAHHTGANNLGADYIARHPELGLCSQIHLDREGVATLCGVGIAWHAGVGSHEGWPTNNANAVSIGIEANSDGVSPWPAKMMDAYYRICAAILWYLGKRATPHTLIGHWEYSARAQGKWDPGAGNGRSGAVMDMNRFRAEVNKRIDAHNRPKAAAQPVGKKPAGGVPATPLTAKYFVDFFTGYMKAVASDVKDVRQQVTGGRDSGNYPGWPQLGGRTVVDAVAAIGEKLGVEGMHDIRKGRK